MLTGIPKLSAEKRNEAKRFVTLIDALYEHKVKLIATAAAPPGQIYKTVMAHLNSSARCRGWRRCRGKSGLIDE